jgi:predicted transcriptional regulator
MSRTIELDDNLVWEIEKLARREATTPSAIVERAIRRVLSEFTPGETSTAREPRDATVGGEGLQPPFTDDNWAAIREAAYERG